MINQERLSDRLIGQPSSINFTDQCLIGFSFHIDQFFMIDSLTITTKLVIWV